MVRGCILVLILVGFGCSPKVISTERTVRDSVIYREVEKEVLIPRSSGVSEKVNLDSLVDLLRKGVDTRIIEKTLIKEDPETKMKVGILIDSLGNLQAVCDQQERLITILVEEREILRTKFERVVVRERQNFLIGIWGYIRTTGIIILLSIMGIFLYRALR